MSISSAPSAVAHAASVALSPVTCAPDGKPTTVHTAKVRPTKASTTCTWVGDTQTAPTPSSAPSRQRSSTSMAVASGFSSVWSSRVATSARVVTVVVAVVAARSAAIPGGALAQAIAGR